MNTYQKILVATGALALAGLAACNTSEKSDEAPVLGSIRPTGNPKAADLPALTKISLLEAMKDAQAAVPGEVITAELEVEDGNLQYSFDIVGADKKVTEVEIDAGNGKVLGTDSGEDKD
jgi:uncharacterized membrane protein YkoI